MSFKAAADELFLTPSAISHQVQLLEGALGHRLFRRRPRPLVLTPAGAALFPILRTGFDAFAEAVASVRDEAASPRLRVTTTNAFAARWLLPRLPLWRAAYPETAMEIIGTDAVIDMGGACDVAVRYAFEPPAGLASIELLRDRFWPVASPDLDGAIEVSRPSDLTRFPLVHASWPDTNVHAPTWRRWISAAKKIDPQVPLQLASGGVMFREELHTIDAVIAGHGVGLLSDVLIQNELENGKLIKVLDIPLPGLGFYLAYMANDPLKSVIDGFLEWIMSVR